MKLKLAILFLFLPNALWAHARLLSPAPRNNNAGIKSGPCGGLARSANPTTVVGGQMLNLQWQETIDHPGRYIFALSYAGDQAFSQNILATIVDTQDTGPLPHMYTAQVQIPDVNCSTCTIQMIQSMEEDPAAPTYYYSCADIRIVSSTSEAPGEVSQTSATEKTYADFGGGCGSVQAAQAIRPNLWLLLLALIPIFTWLGMIIFLRPHRQSN